MRKILAALLLSVSIIPASVGPSEAFNQGWRWNDMPDKTFSCDSASPPPQYVVVWAHPSEKKMTAQFGDQKGPIETYSLSALSPSIAANGRPSWRIVSHEENNATTTILMWDEGGTYRNAGWVFSARGHGVYNCSEFIDSEVQPNNWATTR